MRVLVAHDVTGAREGGMTRIMRFIHAQLATRGYSTSYLHAEDVTARSLVRRFAFPYGVYQHARGEARAGRPFDILNVHEPSAVATLLARRQLGNPHIVVTSHGVEQRAWELALEEGRLGREGPRFKTRIVYPATSLWQSRFGFIHADHVLCLNEEDREFLHTRFGVAQSRITRMVPGADPLYAEAAAGRDYASGHRILFAATWRKNKGIEDLVPAIETLVDRNPNTELMVLGGGVPDHEVLNAFAARVRLNIRCITAASEEQTARVFASADLFLLPSLFEGTPLTLMEAMMSGLPIVTTGVCGMKDIIEHGTNGVLVPIRSPRDIVSALEGLAADRERRTALGTAAHRDAAARYTWRHAADRVARAYDSLTPRPEARIAS